MSWGVVAVAVAVDADADVGVVDETTETSE